MRIIGCAGRDNAAGSEDLKHQEYIDQVVAALVNQRCWYVSAGSVGTTFQLAVGKKIRRARSIQNTEHPRTYRDFEGSANLLVWCTWRLEGTRRVVTSSDDSVERAARGLCALQKATIRDVNVITPAWDLSLTFDDNQVLRVFCDFTPSSKRSLEYWSLHLPTSILFAGPGVKYGLESRDAKKKSTSSNK